MTMLKRYTIFGFFVFLAFLMFFTGCQRKDKAKNIVPIPVIDIVTDTQISWENPGPCYVDYQKEGDSVRWTGMVKFRGGISSKYGKHSYSLKLSDSRSLCDLPMSKNWVINASYIDKTFMRHKLCYDLFRQMGGYNLAPMCGYALVRENGHPQGLYVVMQRLNKSSLKINKEDSSAVVFKEPKIFYPEKDFVSFDASEKNFHEQKYPDFDVVNRNAEMDALRHFFLHSTDEEFEREIGNIMDMQNVVDWHLMILFTNNGDGVLKNFYLYKVDASTPYRIALWDCDHSFGRDGDNEMNMLERLTHDNRNLMLARLMKMPEYKKRLALRWAELRKSGIFTVDNIARMMKVNDAYIQSGLEENTRLWPNHSEFYFDDNDYEAEKAIILRFVPLSLQRLDRQFGYTTE